MRYFRSTGLVKKKNPEQELVLLKLKLEAKELECDLQGEIIATYHKQVQNLLALVTRAGRGLGIKEELEPEAVLKDLRKAL